MSSWQPVAPDALAQRIAGWLAGLPGLLRVAVDGPPSADPDAFAAGLVPPLRALGRPAVLVAGRWFLRDAALRFEHGREDAASYPDWLDAGALRREVLDAVATSGHYLPSLRDPRTNRSTRAPRRQLAPGSVVIVSGTFLLGRDLPFERTVHLAQSGAARRRSTPADEVWTLAAFDAYDARVRPSDTADLVVKLDDPRHPAARWT